MKRLADTDDHLPAGDDSSADAPGGALSLADTLEEDGERYRDVIRDLTEFEEAGGAGDAEAVAPDAGVHNPDAGFEATVA